MQKSKSACCCNQYMLDLENLQKKQLRYTYKKSIRIINELKTRREQKKKISKHNSKPRNFLQQRKKKYQLFAVMLRGRIN